jgi:hypothetical protein
LFQGLAAATLSLPGAGAASPLSVPVSKLSRTTWPLENVVVFSPDSKSNETERGSERGFGEDSSSGRTEDVTSVAETVAIACARASRARLSFSRRSSRGSDASLGWI